MPANDLGSLRAAFSNFNRPESEKEAELKLLGRTVEPAAPEAPPKPEISQSYQVATSSAAPTPAPPSRTPPRPDDGTPHAGSKPRAFALG